MTPKPFYFDLPAGEAFVGARAQRLADLLSKQGDAFFQSKGIVVPVRCVSTVLYLHKEGPASLVEIATALNEPHQLTAKRTVLLQKLRMLSCKDDPNDGRRRIFRLTKKGREESEKLDACCQEALTIFEGLNRELALNLGKALDAAYDALAHTSILDRSENDISHRHRANGR